VRRVVWVGIGALVWNVIAAIVAVAANWPSQFGRVGTDAGTDVITAGTAISAPALPLAILVLSLLLLRARGRWQWVGLAGFSVVAVLFAIGGLGEVFARATPQTPKAVLVVGGLCALAIAIAMLLVALEAIKESRKAARFNAA
jgi:hypothetical protein